MRTPLFVIAIIFTVALAACNNEAKTTDADNNPSELISGNSQKTWHATHETDAEGDKDKLNKDERKETITFYSNGKMTMSGPAETQEGTWSHEGTTLSLQFPGAPVAETFAVLELNKNTMRLQAGDGSELKLKAD